MAEKSVEKPNDILKDFHEILQRCCQLEDTLLKNVGLLNCIKNNEASSSKDLEKSQAKLQVLTQKTDALESDMNKLTAKDFQSKEIDLQKLEKRCEKTVEIYEKSKETFRQLLQEIEQEKCDKCEMELNIWSFFLEYEMKIMNKDIKVTQINNKYFCFDQVIVFIKLIV